MSSVIVAGVLTTPMGDVASDVVIRVTALLNKGSTLKSSTSTYATDAEGIYSFNVVYGYHEVEIHVTDTYILAGTFIVDASTPTEITIIDLLSYNSPVEILSIIEGEPDWEELVADLEDSSDTEYSYSMDSAGDSNTTVIETKSVYANDRLEAYLGKETLVVKSDDAQSSYEATSYSDKDNNNIVTDGAVLTTPSGELRDTLQLGTSSDGESSIKINRSGETPTASFEDSITLDERTESVSLVESVTLTDVGSHNTEVTVTVDEFIKSSSAIHLDAEFKSETTSVSNYVDDNSLVVEAQKVTFSDTASLGGHTMEQYQQILSDGSGNFTSMNMLRAYTTTLEAYIKQTIVGTQTITDIKTNVLNISDGEATSVLSIDTVNRTATLNGTLSITNTDDFKGAAGDTIYEVFQYSIDGITDWHDTFVSEDIYRRFNTSINGVVDASTWSSPIKLNAVDGADGDSIWILYNYATTVDSDAWHTVMVTGDVWRRERTMSGATPTSEWSTPAQIKGTDGTSGYLTSVEYQYATAASVTEEEWHYNFSTGDHFRRERVLQYVDQDAYTAGTPIEETVWSGISQIVPIQGIDYGYGLSGSGSYVISLDSVSDIPDSEGKDANILTISGRDAQQYDVLTYQSNATATTEFAKQFIRNATEWEAFALVVDGSAIINGTLAAEAIKAGTVTSDLILGQKITAGTGENVAVMDGAHATYRFYAGSATPTSAPFTVDQSGHVIAKSMAISGTSSFKGAVTFTSAVFDSESTVQLKSSNYVTGSTGWAINSNGNAEFNNGTFNGTIYAANINGDVVGYKMYTPTNYTYTASSGDYVFIVANTSVSSRARIAKLEWEDITVIGSSGSSPDDVSAYLAVLVDDVKVWQSPSFEWNTKGDTAAVGIVNTAWFSVPATASVIKLIMRFTSTSSHRTSTNIEGNVLLTISQESTELS